jgi:hypothetical protein
MLAFIKILFIFTLQFGNNETKAPFVCTAFCQIPWQPDCLCIHSGFFSMKKIPLTRGHFALVDNEDYKSLIKMKWYSTPGVNTFYAKTLIILKGEPRKSRYKMKQMHRLIMNPPDNMQIDHINHNGLDNRKENLRLVTSRGNHLNRLNPNKCGYPGLTKSWKKYRAQININGKKKHLGVFKTPEEAYAKYMEAFNNIENKL